MGTRGGMWSVTKAPTEALGPSSCPAQGYADAGPPVSHILLLHRMAAWFLSCELGF